MTVVPPSDHLFVIFIFDAVFSHGRSGSVSGNVVDAIINVIVIIVFFFLFGVDIKAVFIFFVNGNLCFFKGRANAFFQFVQKSSLESFAEIGVVKVVNNSPEAVIGETTLGKKTMDMWIPLQGSAKGMQDANETRDKVPAFIQ